MRRCRRQTQAIVTALRATTCSMHKPPARTIFKLPLLEMRHVAITFDGYCRRRLSLSTRYEEEHRAATTMRHGRRRFPPPRPVPEPAERHRLRGRAIARHWPAILGRRRQRPMMLRDFAAPLNFFHNSNTWSPPYRRRGFVDDAIVARTADSAMLRLRAYYIPLLADGLHAGHLYHAPLPTPAAPPPELTLMQRRVMSSKCQ